LDSLAASVQRPAAGIRAEPGLPWVVEWTVGPEVHPEDRDSGPASLRVTVRPAPGAADAASGVASPATAGGADAADVAPRLVELNGLWIPIPPGPLP
jgi:hypothetical protein